MKGVDTIARIRREFFVKGRSIKEIVRDLKVSRNTRLAANATSARKARRADTAMAIAKGG